MSEDDPILICCPYCIRSLGTVEEPDAPFDVPAKCPRCGMDPRNDAPIEMPLAAWGAMAKKRCANCGKDVPKLAVRCGHCTAPLSSPAPAAKKTTKKTATKKTTPKKRASRR